MKKKIVKKEGTKYLVTYVCCADPAKEFNTVESAKKFVMNLISNGEGNECCSDTTVSADKIKIYKVEKVGKISVDIIFQ